MVRSEAEAEVVRRTMERKTTTKNQRNRMQSSFTRERGWCCQFAPVSWLASKDFSVQICIGPSQSKLQWPGAISSLTVARQRGICTRFPVPLERGRTREPFFESLKNVLAEGSGRQTE